MSSRSDASAARQALRHLAQRVTKVPLDALDVRGDVLAASLSKTRKVCGKPNCKCARGDKHVVYQLSWTEDGRRRSTHIRADELSEIRAAVGRYRHLRRCRAELLRIASEGAALIDTLIEALRVPPPDKSRKQKK
ncbi:MAG: hypothetical protein KAI66_12455 [Lentisphaeria bacterium]|nr:hypothetical protein [Lentisphaeria bacterium]